MNAADAARTPVLVGVGQAIEREEVVTTVDLAVRAARAAFADAPGVADRIQRVTMVAVSFSPVDNAPATAIASALGLSGVHCEGTRPGGNTPQWLVNRAAAEIAAGTLDATLFVGAEATRSMNARDPDADFMRVGLRGPAEGGAPPDPVVGLSMSGVVNEAQALARWLRPADVYPVFDSALAARAGRDPAAQRAHIGRLLARFSDVAAANPYAWFRKSLSAAEISTPSDANRLTAEPYTKRMNSFPHVDQGSALLLTSLEIARAAGLGDQCVFPWAGASNADVPPAERPGLYDSPGIRAASGAIFAATGTGIDDFGCIDLYSCFPSAFEVAADSIGLAQDDPRGLTVTGGLPFFGGPGNNYSSHAIASLALRLRESGGLGYVGANGGFLSKHSLGIYAATPPPKGFQRVDTAHEQEQIDASALPMAEGEVGGTGTVVGGTVVYGRDGVPSAAPVVATLDDGRRVVANADPALLPELTGRSLVGARMVFSGRPPVYVPAPGTS